MVIMKAAMMSRTLALSCTALDTEATTLGIDEQMLGAAAMTANNSRIPLLVTRITIGITCL